MPVIDADAIKNMMKPLANTKLTKDFPSSGNNSSNVEIRNIKVVATNKT